MRGPVHLQHAGRDKEARVSSIEAKNSPDAVIWEIGLVVAALLGLALAVSATLTAYGIN